MALTSDEQRRCYVHLRVLQVSRTGTLAGGVPHLTQATHVLQTALGEVTANGEATVRELLTTLDALRTKLVSADTRFQAAKVGPIELNPKEFQDRLEQYEHFRLELAAALGVLELLGGGGAVGLQGPWREP